MALFRLEYNELDDVSRRGAGNAVPQDEGGIVDVVSDYRWTLSPKEARRDTPYIQMIERRLNNDVMLQQLIYYLKSTTEIPLNTIDTLLNPLEERLSPASGGGKDTITNKLLNKVGDTIDIESPYDGLYSMEDTGWVYFLPFFQDENHTLTNNWSTEGVNSFDKIVKAVGDIASETSGAFNKLVSGLGGITDGITAQPGTYIEQAKQYQFSAGGPSYTVEFNLYNTFNVKDVIRNWELCFLLLYQNLPNRRSKTIFDPPPLYEITIPGVRRSPASFIKSLSVKFLGATRLMDLGVGRQFTGDSKLLRTIVPDAYHVTIEIEDVFPESKNFLQSVVEEYDRIRVSSGGETVSRFGLETPDQLEDSQHNGITVIDLSPKAELIHTQGIIVEPQSLGPGGYIV